MSDSVPELQEKHQFVEREIEKDVGNVQCYKKMLNVRIK